MIQQISGVRQQQTEFNKLRLAHNDTSFQTLLQERIGQQPQQGVRLSRHAQERAQQRGIQMTPGLMHDLEASVEKASAKGARDIVVISPEQAFIVNVPSRLVITAMTTEEMKENVFTNIDGAVIL